MGLKRKFRRHAGLMSLALLWLAAAAAAARADSAAGRDAYDKGDFKRAMAEWQAGADRNEADAEFGLGQLYEFGTGDLKQSYKQADYWYRKAADQGNVEAQYRLALIWAVGGDDFGADLAEAYKWATIAVDSKAVWSTLAADLKSQLDKVTSASQRTDAERRVAAWKEASAAKKEEPRVAVAPPVRPPDSTNKGSATGCPGWPFPTLPCTEQFPALPGTAIANSLATTAGSRNDQSHSLTGMAAPPRASAPTRPAAKPPLDELNDNLKQIDCASVRTQTSPSGAVSISGAVPDAEQKTRLIRLAERLFPDERAAVSVEVVPPPLCHTLAELQAMRTAGLFGEGELGLRLNNGSMQLRENHPIKLEVRAPAYPSNLRIDYFTLDGQVLHLTPEAGRPAPKLPAGAARPFANAANGQPWLAGGAPFGTELISVIATPLAVDLGSRSQVEQAADYLRDLRGALRQANAPSGQPNVLATLLVKTSP
jgi:hypothetical protein